MLEYITGKIAAKQPTHIVVDAGGMGFRLEIPVSTYNALGRPGDSVRLLTTLHIREDAWHIYGFATEEERSLFNLLMTVSGIGPKSGIAALSGMSAQQIRRAIASSDVDKLTLIPGVGKKTAQRIALELKDKVKSMPGDPLEQLPLDEASEEAVLALETLGYNRAQAERAVGRVMKSGEEQSSDEILKQALGVLAGR